MNDSTVSEEERNVEEDTMVKRALDKLVQRLVEGLEPEQIILYGSRAYGHPTAESDLDLLIIVPTSSKPAHRRDQMAYKCAGAIGVSKDLMVLTREEFEAQARVFTSVARRAKEEGIVLYERGNTH